MKILLLVLFFLVKTVYGCPVYFNHTILDTTLNDPLFKLLADAKECPASSNELHEIFKKNAFHEQISMVANRGRNNPRKGSFSFFEAIYDNRMVNKGDFFIGYFSKEKNGYVVLDNSPRQNKLLIEAIAWDSNKKLFNFYELIGLDNTHSRWFYRGDSLDALNDNKNLYLGNVDDKNHFGRRMRCSACHNAGEPILKELATPHNDWWQRSRELSFTPNTPDKDVAGIIQKISDVSSFAKSVQQGMRKLNLQHELSLAEQLRPLFCTVEINIESAKHYQEDKISIPSAFWLNPVLGQIDVSIPTLAYQQLLTDFELNFPETTLLDADNPWLTPVKSANDIAAIRALIERKIINAYFVEAVLMIDFKHPLFSKKRCDLLALIPKNADKYWQEIFIINLIQSNTDAGEELGRTLQINNHLKFGEQREAYRRELVKTLISPDGLREIFQQLLDNRQAVFDGEISKNPLGQILEPGFRVIFPVQRKDL